MIVNVRVKPGSRKEKVVEVSEDRLEVRVSAPPEKGKANERLIELLAKHFKVPKSKVKIVRGKTSREKLVEIEL
ncbi:DUF167 domain-containing protein [Hydrogenivirga sp.]